MDDQGLVLGRGGAAAAAGHVAVALHALDLRAERALVEADRLLDGAVEADVGVELVDGRALLTVGCGLRDLDGGCGGGHGLSSLEVQRDKPPLTAQLIGGEGHPRAAAYR